MSTIQQVAQQLPAVGSANGSESNNGGKGSNNGGKGSPSGPLHRRVYQACIPCRKRKVKCDMGAVDRPNAPPCVRCRRESKDCYFSITRRKQRLDENDEPIYDPEFVDRNARKRQFTSESGSPEPRPGSSVGSRQLNPAYRYTPIQPPNASASPGDSVPQYNQTPRPQQQDGGSSSAIGFADANIRYENPEARSAMRKEIYGPHDALDLLYQAATDGYACPIFSD